MTPSPLQLVETIVLFAVPVVVAITLHEAAHGYVARYFGDDTAERAGRISLNPLRHVDPLGTVILPALLILAHAGFIFGYAKPVPVNFSRLRRPKQDMVWVAAAGPGMNLLLATISAVLIRAFVIVHVPLQPLWTSILAGSVEINLLLAVFNLIPIPPLDGGRVAVGLLPDALARPLAEFARFGILSVLVIFLVLPYFGIDVFRWLVQIPVQFLQRALFGLMRIQLP